MNLIFLTMSPFYDLDVHNIYADLLREFVAHGHKPYLVAPCEKKKGMPTELIDKGDYVVLRVQVGNTNNVSFIEKGISTILLEQKYIQAIKKYLKNIRFDLILYSTPPVTLAGVVKYLKYAYNAPTYLMLKDIFPQNAVDLGLMTEQSVIYRYFRAKERTLYSLSDSIGCMSQANVDYFLAHNTEVTQAKVHINPNAIRPIATPNHANHPENMRISYGIPEDAVVFMYGGNLGKPQDIPFVIQCLKATANREDCHFIVCGTGNEYHLLAEYITADNPSNVTLINGLPKHQYDELLRCCDVGLIFLDYRFTIPNFPSRLLSYMEQAKPVLACTDVATDIGKTIIDGEFGWWCSSDAADGFARQVDEVVRNRAILNVIGNRGHRYLVENYRSVMSFEIILDSIRAASEGTNNEE